MSTLSARSRLLGVATICVALTLPTFGFGAAIAQASPLPAPMDDPPPPPPPPPPAPTAPDPSAIINQANTVLPMISQFAQFLPSFLNPGAGLQDPTDPSVLQPQMLNPFFPSS